MTYRFNLPKRSGMLIMGKYRHLFFFVTLFIWENTGVSSQLTIAVVINSAKSQNASASTFPMTIKRSFEKIPSTLDNDRNISIVYKDLNSTFCDLGNFLSIVDEILACDIIVVLLLEDCQCEKMFMSYLDILNITSVSNCEQPLFAAKVTSSILKRVRKKRQLYLLAPADAIGEEFYQDFSLELQRQKLKLHRTLWVGVDSGKSNQLQKELKSVAQNIDNNITSGATFVLGFLHLDDFRLKSLVNLSKRILGKQFGKILWIFPVVHLDLSNVEAFNAESFKALAFGNPETVHCFHNNQNCALGRVLEKTSHVLKSYWDPHRHNLTEYNRNTTTVECRVQNVERGHMKYSVKNQECKTSRYNCYIGVLELTTDRYTGYITSKRIATWNGVAVQPCSPEDGSNNIILSPTKPVFRVPVVSDYPPFTFKHEFSDLLGKCPLNLLPCYGQQRKNDNTTVINYADKYCCSGLVVDVLNYFTDKFSHEFELYFQAENRFGAYDNETGKWNGEVQDIISGKGDIALDLTFSPERCSALDCSQLGYISDGFNAVLKLELSEKDNFAALARSFRTLLSPFGHDLLIATFVGFNVFLFLIWATEKICLSYRNKRRGRERQKFTLLETTSYVWAIVFGRDVGDSKKPLTLSGRYLSSWLAFLSLILVSVYVARLAADNVKDQPIKPFTSLHDPRISNRKLKLGLIIDSLSHAYFRNTRDPVLKQHFENNIRPNLLSSPAEAFKAVKIGTLDGFIADTLSLTAHINQDPSCSLSLMGGDFSVDPVGFMFRKDWPWAEEFKLQEMRMNEIKKNEDLLNSWKRLLSCPKETREHPQLKIADLSAIFLVLIFAIAYCCFSLVLENIHSLLLHRYRNSNGRWNVSHT